MNWSKECVLCAKMLPKERRQEYMDLIHRGKTLGEAQKECKISFAAATGIIHMNTEKKVFLRRESL